ncbi:unnamed protein product [marine sediment metagenome]|uniref:Uncharacterized protein n=1 Tax=marine sediment metagenome TaxID=412755 RepID=X1R337_9ZZZZ
MCRKENKMSNKGKTTRPDTAEEEIAARLKDALEFSGFPS